MAKCIRCGRSGMGVLHQAIKLKDKNLICFKCYKELGFEPWKDMTTAPLMYTWDDIKDGKEEMEGRRLGDLIMRTSQAEAAKYNLSVRHYKELEAAGASTSEMRIMSAICAVLDDEGCDPDALEISLGPNNSLMVMIDGVVVVQYRSDKDVKWLMLPNESEEKIRITGPAKINTLASRIVQAYRAAI